MNIETTHTSNKPSLRGGTTKQSPSPANRAQKQSSALVPELRFKEFNGEWNQTTLGNLFTFKNGLNSDKEKYGYGIKFINVLDIIGEEVITYDSIIGKVEVTEKEFEKNEVIYGDVLFQRSSETREEVGQANIYVDKNESSVFGGFVIRGRKKGDYNPYFMNYLLKTSSARKEITTKSGGSTRYNVGQESLGQVFVTHLTLPEQHKIASFLSAIDQKIQQLTKKKVLLEQYKKGVMQQLFSGKLRFKDEDGNSYPDWEEKRLGEVGKIVTGSTPPTSVLEYYNGNRLFVSPADIDETRYVKKTKTTLTELGLKKGRKIAKGAVLFVCIGSTIGKIAQAGYECITNQQINAIIANEGFSNEFIYSLLVLFGSKIKLLAGVQAVPQINKTDFSKFKFNFPSLPEQQKIATYLSNIDTKIEDVHQQLTQTQLFKKGLLQSMFV